MGASTLSNSASEYCCVDAETCARLAFDWAMTGSAETLDSATITDKVMFFIHSP